MKKIYNSFLTLLLLVVGTVASWAEFQDFEIDLTQQEVALPAGVTQISYPQNGAAYNGAQHGWSWYAVEFAVDGPVKVTLGGCQYIDSEQYQGYVHVNGAAPADGGVIANKTEKCWDQDPATYVASYNYNGEAATLRVFCGHYCPYVKVESTAIPSSPAGFNNAAATFAWAVGNESETTCDAAIGTGLSTSKVTVGTDLTKDEASYTLSGVGYGPLCRYQPITSNPGCVATDMIEYTLQMKKGVTFTIESVEFDAVKEGTDNAYFAWSYTIDGTEGKVIAYNDPTNQIRRNNDTANPQVPVKHTEEISGATAGEKVTLRFYISNVANNKKMSIGNIKINGKMNGAPAERTFKDFKVDFRTDPYTVVAPEAGLPEGVTINGTFHDGQHGYTGTTVTVPVDGPVKFTIGGCGFANNATVKDAKGNTLATIDTRSAGCDNGFGTYANNVTWTYNSEVAQTLTLNLGKYCPYIEAKACDLIPMRTVTYYATDGKTIIGSEEVEGGSALAYKYGASDITVTEGSKFRGWFNSTQASAIKVKEGESVQENLALYAKVTPIEVAKVGAIFNYPLNSPAFYPEDHECFSSTGAFHDAQHGFELKADQTISLNVAGNAIVSISNCCYSKEGAITVTDANGTQVGEAISIPCTKEEDGATASVSYEGPATTLTISASNGAYIHNVTVYNVDKVPTKNEAGYYEIAANDAASLQVVIAKLQEGDKIFLPNGTYDFGEKALTTISANNVSIIGESMEGTIIRNCPPKENEGIGTTATLLNTSNGLYLQDLTLQNALDYYGTGSAGRAVCLQDKGANTICKRVKMLSYQDTYYSNKPSNFYWEDSEIHGTVDYICGDGNVIFNRTKLVNESRSATSKSGSDVITAPATSESCEWGYVFLDCSVESKCKDFTYARAWQNKPRAQFLNTTILDGSLNAARFNKAAMGNSVADKFTEYNTKDANGNVISPASNVIEFTSGLGNKTYETILSAAEAEAYTVANIFGAWAPDSICADAEEGTVYLVDGKITTTLPTTVGAEYRIANGRGGFGAVKTVDPSATAIVMATEKANKIVKFLKNDGIYIQKDGKVFDAVGAEVE